MTLPGRRSTGSCVVSLSIFETAQKNVNVANLITEAVNNGGKELGFG